MTATSVWTQHHSQGFEDLHFAEGFGLDGTDGILSQVPVGMSHCITHH